MPRLTLQERRQKLFDLAKHTLPAEVWAELDVPTDRLLDERAAEIQKVLVDADVEIPKSISVPERAGTFYHHNMSVDKADQLWDAGFRDIDSWDESGRTPILKSSILLSRIPIVKFPGSSSLDYCQWLLDHGADPHREIRYIHDNKDDNRKPVMGLTVLHCIAYVFGEHILETLDPRPSHSLRFVHEPSLTIEKLVIESDSRDDCHCACSSSGCTPLTDLLKTINRTIHLSCVASKKRSKLRRLAVQHVEWPGHPGFSAPMRSKVAGEVIRFETFGALQLSHTCCGFELYGPAAHTVHRRYTPDDVREIHEEWEEHLSKHEDLVSEFCHKFRELGGTLMSSLEGYWQTRMDEVLKEEKPYDEEDICRLREMGVVLEEVSEERGRLY